MEQIKPCPWCNVKPKIIEGRVISGSKIFSYQAYHNCDFMLSCVIKTKCYETPEEAIAAWNNRAEPTDLEKMREACSKCPAHARLEAEIEEIMGEPPKGETE